MSLPNPKLTESTIDLDRFNHLKRGIERSDQITSYRYLIVSDSGAKEILQSEILKNWPSFKVFNGTTYAEYFAFKEGLNNEKGILISNMENATAEMLAYFNTSIDTLKHKVFGPVIVFIPNDKYEYIRNSMPDSLSRGHLYEF